MNTHIAFFLSFYLLAAPLGDWQEYYPFISSGRKNLSPIFKEQSRRHYIKTELASGPMTTFGQHYIWMLGDQGNAEGIPRAFVLRSSDAGKTWQKHYLDPDGIYFDIFFIDSQVGWIAGSVDDRSTILKSTDGGANWSAVSAQAESSMVKIHFVDLKEGWTMAEDGELLHTTDGGMNWRSLKLKGHGWTGNEFRGWLLSISFSDRFNGWIVGEGAVYQTTDGGLSWGSRYADLSRMLVGKRKRKVDYLNVRLLNSKLGYMIADIIDKREEADFHEYVLLKTTNGGRSWSRVLKTREFGLRDISVVSEEEACLISQGGHYLLRTVDGGHKWIKNAAPGKEIGIGVTDFRFVDSRNGWVILNINDYFLLHGLYYTTDGGKTWQEAKLPDG